MMRTTQFRFWPSLILSHPFSESPATARHGRQLCLQPPPLHRPLPGGRLQLPQPHAAVLRLRPPRLQLALQGGRLLPPLRRLRLLLRW